MSYPLFQKQHVIPEVYLKQFGYQINGHWKVSVIFKGEKMTRQKSIGSFTAITNVFDIVSDNPQIARLFEGFNKQLEDEYTTIIDELDSSGTLSEKSIAYLVQTIVNFIIRSDIWREFVLGLLNHPNKENFIKSILALVLTKEEFSKIEKSPIYRHLVDCKPEDVLNEVLLYFSYYLYYRLAHFKIEIIKAQVNKPWFTSTNPVILELDPEPFNIIGSNTKIYFPISPDYVAYLYYSPSESVDEQNKNILVVTASDSQAEEIQQKIIKNDAEYVIFSGEFKFKA